MKAVPQPSLFQRMGKPCLPGCLTPGVHRNSFLGAGQESNFLFTLRRGA